MSQRIIKFRAAYANPDGVRWAYGLLSYVQPDYIQIIAVDDATGTSVYNCIPETLGQFTGMKDRNGREIFEGDVIMHGTGRLRGAGVVRWYEYGAGFKVFRGHDHYEPYDAEIIGNIHENPTLIPA